MWWSCDDFVYELWGVLMIFYLSGLGKIGLFKVRGFSYALKMGKLFKEKFPIYNRYNG